VHQGDCMPWQLANQALAALREVGNYDLMDAWGRVLDAPLPPAEGKLVLRRGREMLPGGAPSYLEQLADIRAAAAAKHAASSSDPIAPIDTPTAAVAVADTTSDDGGDECPVCCIPITDEVWLEPCGHKFCQTCASSVFLARAETGCSLCRQTATHVWLPLASGDRRVPIVPPTEMLLDQDDRGRQHRDENGLPVSLAESARRGREAIPSDELPSWTELADAAACAACLGRDGAAVVRCDDCNCGFHPGCATTLCELTSEQIEALPNWYCSVCRPTWTTGVAVALDGGRCVARAA
jgi:hypothetical protein